MSAEDKFEQTNDDSGSSDDSGDDGGFGAFFDDEPEEEVAEAEEDPETDSFDDMANDEPAIDSDKEYTPMFWIFYPEARQILSKAYAFNQKNMSKPFSFDRLINARRFSGTIYKETNVYQDRNIRDYISKNALMQLLESDRIKEKIRNKEQDMWSY